MSAKAMRRWWEPSTSEDLACADCKTYRQPDGDVTAKRGEQFMIQLTSTVTVT